MHLNLKGRFYFAFRCFQSPVWQWHRRPSQMDSWQVIATVQHVIILLRSMKKEQDAGEEIRQSPERNLNISSSCDLGTPPPKLSQVVNFKMCHFVWEKLCRQITEAASLYLWNRVLCPSEFALWFGLQKQWGRVIFLACNRHWLEGQKAMVHLTRTSFGEFI